jgi:hypothetical protein
VSLSGRIARANVPRMTRALPALACAILAVGCGDNALPPDDSNESDAAPELPRTCPLGHEDKILFTQADGCTNDGAVEFCIPAANAQLRTAIETISADMVCAPGGGRARCLASPGLLLCTYPTAYPAQCVASDGAMTDAVWADMCEIAAQPPIVEIVPMWGE